MTKFVDEEIEVSDEMVANLGVIVGARFANTILPASLDKFNSMPKITYDELVIAVGEALLNDVLIDSIQALIETHRDAIEGDSE